MNSEESRYNNVENSLNVVCDNPSRESNSNLSVLSYNICGIKKQSGEFYEIIDRYDIFALFETHLESEEEGIERYFRNFKCYYEPAVRRSARGRASGGMVIGYKVKWGNLVSFCNIGGAVCLKIAWNEKQLIIYPAYLNCNRWEEDFGRMQNDLSTTDTNIVMVIGDLNARTGCRESFLNFGVGLRRSEDSVINREGEKIIECCNDFGLAIVNGCSDKDRNGNFTFIGGQGQSVIDYGLAGRGWWPYLKDFEIFTEIWSDHLPLRFYITLDSAITERSNNIARMMKWKDSFTMKYKDEVDKSLALVQHDLRLQEIDEIIINAYQVVGRNTAMRKSRFREPWFDFECQRARNRKLKLLNKWRNSRSDDDLSQYRAFGNEYKNLIRDKKKGLVNKYVVQLGEVRSPADFWKLAKQIAGSQPRSGSRIDVECLKNHFENLLNPQVQMITYDTAWQGDYIHCLDREISNGELDSALKNSAGNKAPGPNGIPVEFYKNLTENMKRALVKAFNKIYEEGAVPEDYLKATIFPIHKKGDKMDPANYRGISFLNAALKLFTTILQDRLVTWMEENNVLSEFQAGFRKTYSTIDQIFSLTNIAQMRMERDTKLYVFFVDFRTAFDHVQRNLLFYKLSHKGMSFRFLRMLRGLYNCTSAYVTNGTAVSESFITRFGIKQGCNISPSLFSLYIDDIHEQLHGGVDIGDVKVKVLMYADDLVLLAKTPEAMQSMINRVEQYCDKWRLTVNLEKSKVMIFRKGTGKYSRHEKWYFKRTEIEIVREYMYLGFLITSNLNVEKHIKKKAGEAKAALAITWKKCMMNNDVKPEAKYKIFQGTALMTLLYAAPCFGFKTSESAEGVQRYFLKRSLKLPMTTPHYMLTLEVGLPDIFLTSLKLHFSYVFKLLKNYPNKLSAKIARYLLSRKQYWSKEWHVLAENVGMEINFEVSNLNSWPGIFHEMLNKLYQASINECKIRAVESQSRLVYPKLSHELGEHSYFRKGFNSNVISFIFKARGELLNLNFVPHRRDLQGVCSMCNTGNIESVFHFLGECPILSELRQVYFYKRQLIEIEMIDYLNGKDWLALYNYIKEAFNYRNLIVNELL